MLGSSEVTGNTPWGPTSVGARMPAGTGLQMPAGAGLEQSARGGGDLGNMPLRSGTP